MIREKLEEDGIVDGNNKINPKNNQLVLWTAWFLNVEISLS